MSLFLSAYNNSEINMQSLEIAAQVIKEGGLVALPTETVYGLGANALNKAAIAKIYTAKGRPSDNPLIVHIKSIDQVTTIAKNISNKAQKLMEHFWPGAITLILEKKDTVPYETTSGLETVAVRIPNNEIALKLIEISNLPIAAPSANISGKPSPTTANHVKEDFWNKIDIILDGGSCQIGLESTVIDMTCEPPEILRPGAITKEMIEKIIGEINAPHPTNDEEKPKSPGMKYKHYSPKADVFIIEADYKKSSQAINKLIEEKSNLGFSVGVMTVDAHKHYYNNCTVISLGAANVAANLFATLREFDEKGIDIVFSENFENEELGHAIMNRLTKSAGGKIIKL